MTTIKIDTRVENRRKIIARTLDKLARNYARASYEHQREATDECATAFIRETQNTTVECNQFRSIYEEAKKKALEDK